MVFIDFIHSILVGVILIFRKSVDDNRMKKCLITELNTLLAVSQVKQITSVYFGGGITRKYHHISLKKVIYL